MHKFTTAAVAALTIGFTSGCATAFPVGSLYTDIALPVDVSSAAGGSKQGQASCQTILAAIATGDCSIEAAKQNGGITTVSHMDWKTKNILGIIGNYTLTVYGE